MKKLFTLLMLAIVVSFAFDAFAQTGQDWKWQNPTPQGNTLRYIKYWDANNWYAIGFAGTFMKTTNAGTTWTFNHKAGGSFSGYTGQSTNMYDAHFFNQNTGVVVGSSSVNGGIVRTTDGGTTWDTAYSYTVTTGIFYQVQFLNNNLGFAVGTVTPKIWRTTNGGITWAGIATAPTTTVYDIYPFDSLNQIISTTSGNVQKTTDAGATWSAVIPTGSTTVGNKLHFVNNNLGYIAGATGKFGFTTDGGNTWTNKLVTVGTTNTSAYYDIAAIPTTVTPSMKLNENFESGVVPPTGWTLGLPTPAIWGTAPVSGYGVGTASAKANFYNIGSGFQELISVTLATPTVAGDTLKFDHAYATYTTENDNLDILTSTDAGTTWVLLINLAGGVSGPLVTAPPTTSSFTPTAAQWATKRFVLPAGTNKVSFKGNTAFGNNLYIDNAMIAAGFAPVASAKVFLTGDAFNIYKTQDNGTTWDTVGFLDPNQPWTSTFYATGLSPTGDTLVTVGALGFINRRLSASNRQVFTAVKKVGITYDIWAQNATGTGTILGVGARSSATSAADQVLRSTNGGLTWNVATFPATAYGFLNSIHMINDNTGFACGSLASLFKTTNAGASWDSVATPFGIGAYTLSKVQFVDANTGWVFSKSTIAGDSTIIKTTNGGTSWFKQTLGNALTGTGAQIYWADFVNANTGWIVNYTPRPYKTTDGGNTWAKDSIVDAFGGFMYGIDMVNATTGFITGSSGRIYKTTNGGVLWDTLSKPGNASFSWYGTKFYNHLVGVAVGSNGGTIVTSNGGATWALHNTGGASITQYSLCLLPGSVGFTCGTSGHIWKNVNLPLISGVENTTGIPMSYELSQNYPNPFNPTTTIKFALPKAGLVTIKLYDVAGREIMRIVNSQRFNAGYQTQLFNGSMLASGVYFYSMIVDNNLVDTKKMVLIK